VPKSDRGNSVAHQEKVRGEKKTGWGFSCSVSYRKDSGAIKLEGKRSSLITRRNTGEETGKFEQLGKKGKGKGKI